MDVMVDLETTGVRPEKAGILQLGAVIFNLDKRYIEPFDESLCFNMEVPGYRTWELDTFNWWMTKNQENFIQVMQNLTPVSVVLKALQDKFFKESPKFWCRGPHFDYAFLESYFKDEDMISPFPHWLVRDVRTYVSTMMGEDKPKLKSHVTNKHDARMDCYQQIGELFEAKDFHDENNR